MMQNQPGVARLVLHHSSFGGGEAWQATEGKPSEEEKAIYEKALLPAITSSNQKQWC
jgi:hypothetical protein